MKPMITPKSTLYAKKYPYAISQTAALADTYQNVKLNTL